ncbi:uncharacterized protein LOC141690652 [Apium graveolens]|uniref:uncharacterized protein LOC141690652 n=1 Tax=Apium graveolens TaxID=4045 RepID=UPI003D7B02B8
MGFAEKFIRWIMLCVTTVQYSVCFNSINVGPIYPKWGLRKGGLVSPYLFLFCVEGLSEAIRNAADENTISGCKVSQNAPSITQLLFVDVSLLFFKASREESLVVKSILNLYEKYNGQAINFQTSGIFFSANVRRDKQQEISALLGVHNNLQEGKYLGLPSLIGRSKKSVFNFLKDRVWKRIQRRGNKLLSKGGKTILIKNVAQAIPSYWD